jgi:antitoxin VapB
MNHASDIIAPYLANKFADSPIQNIGRKVSLFRNGANQAVRIPKEFELPGTQATMQRVGNRLIIEAVATLPAKGTVAALAAALESMKDWPVVTEPFPDVDEGLLPLDDVVL